MSDSADTVTAELDLGGIPNFDGKVVDDTAMKFSGLASAIPCGMKVLKIDDVVRITIEGTVTGVSHVVDKDGNLTRIQTIKPLDVEFTPWDDTDPTDDGVLRSNQ